MEEREGMRGVADEAFCDLLTGEVGEILARGVVGKLISQEMREKIVNRINGTPSVYEVGERCLVLVPGGFDGEVRASADENDVRISLINGSWFHLTHYDGGVCLVCRPDQTIGEAVLVIAADGQVFYPNSQSGLLAPFDRDKDRFLIVLGEDDGDNVIGVVVEGASVGLS